MTVQLGVIADDITGACDVAAGVWHEGWLTEVRLGVPDAVESSDASCVIVALKSRTAEPAVAVADSVRSARTLRAWGARLIYQKYCSTFDSTDRGNIGPVADALLDELGSEAVALGTPVTPAAGRTMHRGHLFVGDRLLSDSSLAQHPLTPMRDPDLVRVLGRQTPRPVAVVHIEHVRQGAGAVAKRVSELRTRGARHILFDAVDDGDLDAIATAVTDIPHVVFGGAAGLITALARQTPSSTPGTRTGAPGGRRLILSGSGSARTRAQVAAFPGPAMTLDVDELVADADAVVTRARERIADADPVLITATARPERVAEHQRRWGAARSAELVETSLARIAAAAVTELGVTRILVAGGETSGAVAAALGLGPLTVRRVVEHGVPWMTTTDPAGRRLDVCFKSGNFGRDSLFADVWDEGSTTWPR